MEHSLFINVFSNDSPSLLIFTLCVHFMSLIGITCRNLGTWRNSSQVKLTSEESSQWTRKLESKYKLENQDPFGNSINCASITSEQSCQLHLGTTVPASLGNNCTSVTWEQSCQCLLATIVTESLENSSASFTSDNCALLGSNFASLTWG